MADIVRLQDLTDSKYAEERAAISSGIDYSKYQTDTLLEEAKKLNDFSKLLTSEYDRVKSDANKDGKVDQTEYNNYIIEKNEKPESILRQNRTESTDQNTNNNHNYYHFDSTLLIAIGMICVTIIIKSLLKSKQS